MGAPDALVDSTLATTAAVPGGASRRTTAARAQADQLWSPTRDSASARRRTSRVAASPRGAKRRNASKQGPASGTMAASTAAAPPRAAPPRGSRTPRAGATDAEADKEPLEINEAEELVGKPWHARCEIKAAIDLPLRVCKAFCEYEFWDAATDAPRRFRTETVECQGTKEAMIDYSLIHSIEKVPQGFIDFLGQPLEGRLFVVPDMHTPTDTDPQSHSHKHTHTHTHTPEGT